MTTEKALTVAQPSALSDESQETLDRLVLVKDTLAPDLTLGELQLFALVAHRSGLDPFARQVYAVKRKGRMTIQTGIDGYRSIAARTGEYNGQDEPVYGPDCSCGKGSRHPESSTVRVYRKGMDHSIAATAYWHEYVPEAGPSGMGDVMWRKMPHVMIAKVAEALALRKAFPWDPTRKSGIGSDIYTADEMAQAESDPQPDLRSRIEARAHQDGMTLREFADAVSEMDPEAIRRVREEMYPDASGVKDLTDVQREALLARLQAGPTGDAGDEEEDGSPSEEQAEEGVYEEVPEEPRFTDGTTGEEPPPDHVPLGNPPIHADGACPVASPIDGSTCDREKGHRGRHRSSDMAQSW